MPYPKQSEIEEPLLRALITLGGESKPSVVYPLVSSRFPEVTAEEQDVRLESSPGTRKWTNQIQWVRQRLVEKGEIDGSIPGIWRITPKGRERVSQADSGSALAAAETMTLRDLVNQSRADAKSRLVTELKALTPTGFENFCLQLLGQLGFRTLEVTKRGADGGIDGFGDFRQGAVSIKSAFQAKRWSENPVRRPEIDKLRGAIQGDFDHGVFLTTSRFTKDAAGASYKKGAITILLLDGEAIADLMLERGIGVTREPVYTYEIDASFFEFDGS